MTSPISSPQNIFAIERMSIGGRPPSWLAWFAVALPVAALGDLVCWGLILLAYRPGRKIREVKRRAGERGFGRWAGGPSRRGWPAGGGVLGRRATAPAGRPAAESWRPCLTLRPTPTPAVITTTQRKPTQTNTIRYNTIQQPPQR